MTRLIILIIIALIPCHVFAAGNDIEDYVPPPMFSDEVQTPKQDDYPPLPPRRPAKLKAPQSYIDYLRKHGRAPSVAGRSPPSKKVDIERENLINPSAQDVLEQINPQ